MDELLEIATDAARAAGALLLERFAAPHEGVGTKSTTTDMVSDADRAAEELIVARIARARPQDAILAEEGGYTRGGSGLRWVIDPLDGTTNFLYGIPQWAVSVACEDAEGVRAGVVYDPMREEMFVAARGEGARLNGAPIAVTPLEDLSRALVATGFSYRPEERARWARATAEMLPHVRDIRRAGAAALDLAWAACGRVDAYCEWTIEWWDVAAGTLLVAEAGGRHARLEHDGTPGWVASGPGIFDDLRALAERALA